MAAGSVASSASPTTAARLPLDAEGRWSAHAPLSAGVVGFYLFLIAVLWLVGRATGPALIPDPVLLVVLVLSVFLVRYASTHYSMDADSLLAWRLFGSRRVRLEDVRKIELANLRDLGPVSFFGGWGWRGRTWSPIVGTFDSVHTVSPGVLVSAGDVALFVSPKDPLGFAVELSRRVRSYHNAVELGPGIPGARPGPAARQ